MTQAQSIEMMDLDVFKASLKKVRTFVDDKLTSSLSNKILVVGDVGLDKYLYGSVDRISPEAPVPVVNLSSEEKHLGLAANVAKNFAAMGGRCDLVGLTGQDLAAEEIEGLLENLPSLRSQLLKTSERPTTEKMRILSGQHHLLRLDKEKSSALSTQVKKDFLKHIENLDFSEYSFVILEDYGKGVLFEELCQEVIRKAHEKGAKVLVDPSKKAPLKKFKGADIFKPNQVETLSYTELAGTESYKDLLKWILAEGEFKSIVSTLGASGMSHCNQDGALRVPTFARKVFDVTGAGDTVIAALAYGLSGGLSEPEACIFANFAAGYVVGKVGAVPCSLENIKSHMERFSTSEMSLKLQENL